LRRHDLRVGEPACGGRIGNRGSRGLLSRVFRDLYRAGENTIERRSCRRRADGRQITPWRSASSSDASCLKDKRPESLQTPCNALLLKFAWPRPDMLLHLLQKVRLNCSPAAAARLIETIIKRVEDIDFLK
jgi:hypothetical protein